jgi:hypothetical protein
MTVADLLRLLPEERTRVAVSVAMLIAARHRNEVTSWYGTYGQECLDELLKSLPGRGENGKVSTS